MVQELKKREKKPRESIPRPKKSRLIRKMRTRTESSGLEAESIAIIADVHSNLEALNAVLGDIGTRTDVARILCAGDIVGYGPEPNKVCEKVRSSNIICSQGNHDRGMDLSNLDWFNPDAREALMWTAQRISQRNKEWLLGLPKIYEEKILGRIVKLVHGSPADPLYEYVMPDTSTDLLRHYLNVSKADILVTGHTHIPFVAKFGKKLFINAGSVGQPRDGNPKACYVLLNLKTLKAEIVRVEYNIEAVTTKIRQATLPDALADRLFEGI